MSAPEAEAFLQAAARGDAQADICTDEGRTRFRSAVRAHARAMHEQGRPWPNFMAMFEGGGAPDAVETMVLAGILAGFIPQGDIPDGPARQSLTLVTAQLMFSAEARRMRDGLRAACPEVMEAQQLIAREAIAMERERAAIERARDRGDAERAQRLSLRMAERGEETRARLARLYARIEEKMRTAE
ncbi:MAG: hypothetical protein AB7J28_14800 [Hyphomonadaceae bacterium]